MEQICFKLELFIIIRFLLQVLPVLMLSAPFLGSAVGTPSVAVGEEKKRLHATPHSFAEPPSGVATRTAEEVALKGKLCFWAATRKGKLGTFGDHLKNWC
ncbi:hypothetical protein AMECASPLE_000514 [Ameca splendens]|uniref:Secreted protein n=1 Tax=Ameca splendens TaxID=208324 RepID=A0ABV0XLR9_9TELE